MCLYFATVRDQNKKSGWFVLGEIKKILNDSE